MEVFQKGIQYDLATGVITGCCTPAIDVTNQPMPDGRGQMLVDAAVQYDGMIVDVTGNEPALIADLTTPA